MAAHRISFPFDGPPERGKAVEIAEGVLWARLPLPFRLDHVNLYFIEDDGGWAVVDTGANHPLCTGTWDALLAGPLAGSRLSRVIVTHFHPDHVGLAGWLADRHGAKVLTTETCRDTTRILLTQPEADADWVDFYIRGGMDPDTARKVGFYATGYDDFVTPLPAAVSVVGEGDTLSLGGRDFRALLTGGHAPNQLTLHCADAGIYFPPTRSSRASRRMSASSRPTSRPTRWARSCQARAASKPAFPPIRSSRRGTNCPSAAWASAATNSCSITSRAAGPSSRPARKGHVPRPSCCRFCSTATLKASPSRSLTARPAPISTSSPHAACCTGRKTRTASTAGRASAAPAISKR